MGDTFRAYRHNDLHLRSSIPPDESRNAHSFLIALQLIKHMTLPVHEGRVGFG